jgi:hypothetical protein
MEQLPAFLAATLGAALASELTLLCGLVLLLNLRRLMRDSLKRLEKAASHDPE